MKPSDDRDRKRDSTLTPIALIYGPYELENQSPARFRLFSEDNLGWMTLWGPRGTIRLIGMRWSTTGKKSHVSYTDGPLFCLSTNMAGTHAWPDSAGQIKDIYYMES